MNYPMPWQTLAALILVYWVGYGVFTLVAVVCAFLGWPYVGVAFLFLAFLAITFLIPLKLNFGRHLFVPILLGQAAHQLIAIFVFAGFYFNIGLRDTAGKVSTSFTDAVYVSIATWTTLGAAEFSVPAGYRLLVALEALTAVVSIPVFTALFWLWIQESTVPPDQSYLAKLTKRKSGVEKDDRAAI